MPRSTLFCIALVLCLGVGLLLPAEAEAQGVRFGLKGGVAFAKLRGDLVDVIVDGSPEDLVNFKSGTGFVGGAFVQIPVGTALAIQPEVLYQARISKFDLPELAEIFGEDFTASVRADYIEIPLLLKWQSSDTGVRPFLFAGPSIAFRLNANVRAEFMGMSEEEDIKDDTKSTDFGLVFGAGVAFGNFGLEARYNLGLTSVNTESEGGSLKWGTISLLGGITF